MGPRTARAKDAAMRRCEIEAELTVIQVRSVEPNRGAIRMMMVNEKARGGGQRCSPATDARRVKAQRGDEDRRTMPSPRR
jgi:hypothetical protein